MPIQLDAALLCRDPRLSALHAWWLRARAVRGGALPGRADVDPLAMRGLLPDLYMVDVLRDSAMPVFRYRLIGTAITGRTGRDYTGRRFDEVYPAAALPEFEASFRWVWREARPLRSFGTMEFSGQGYQAFEALEVPLATDGVQIDIILGLFVLLPAE